MSTDVMREAAQKIREDWSDCECHVFERAFADLLEEVAAWEDEGLGFVVGLDHTNWPDAWEGVLSFAGVAAAAYLEADDEIDSPTSRRPAISIRAVSTSPAISRNSAGGVAPSRSAATANAASPSASISSMPNSLPCRTDKGEK